MGLNRHGEAVQQVEDHLIASEEPEVIAECLKVMRDYYGVRKSFIARETRVQPALPNAPLEAESLLNAGI